MMSGTILYRMKALAVGLSPASTNKREDVSAANAAKNRISTTADND